MYTYIHTCIIYSGNHFRTNTNCHTSLTKQIFSLDVSALFNNFMLGCRT